jgi:hypothetical protein
VIPALDPTTGHLPPGRYRTDLDEFHARFVTHNEFAGRPTRGTLWRGFVSYLQTWASIEVATATPGIVHAIWVAGSFVSAEPEPSDIDISPVLDGVKLRAIKGRQGSRLAKRLLSHRESLQRDYHLDVFPIVWLPTTSVFHPPANPEQRDYLTRRGSMDDWWQRVRPPGPEGPPTVESAAQLRGYVEVIV